VTAAAALTEEAVDAHRALAVAIARAGPTPCQTAVWPVGIAQNGSRSLALRDPRVSKCLSLSLSLSLPGGQVFRRRLQLGNTDPVACMAAASAQGPVKLDGTPASEGSNAPISSMDVNGPCSLASR
jgi:hypothetical protein